MGVLAQDALHIRVAGLYDVKPCPKSLLELHSAAHSPAVTWASLGPQARGGSGAYGGRLRIPADSRRLAQPTAPRVHARVRSGVPISISIPQARAGQGWLAVPDATGLPARSTYLAVSAATCLPTPRKAASSSMIIGTCKNDAKMAMQKWHMHTALDLQGRVNVKAYSLRRVYETEASAQGESPRGRHSISAS